MSDNIRAQATRVIHFSKVFGSIQMYLEVSCGDLYQDYSDGGHYPDYAAMNPRAQVVPTLLQSSGEDVEIDNTTWKIGGVTLQFNPSETNGLCKCTTPDFENILALRVKDSGGNAISQRLEVIGNFAQALNGQSVMLECDAAIIDASGNPITTAHCAVPVTVRKVSQDDWGVHIVPSEGKELGIQASDNVQELYCVPEASVAKGAAAYTQSDVSVTWEYFDGTAWVAVPNDVYAANSDPTQITTPRFFTSGSWKKIVVPCGAVDSQLLIRAILVHNGCNVASDTATIYDNSDTLYIMPNPSRDEVFQLGNPELEADLVYTPAVMKGGTDVTANYNLTFKLHGSAGEVMNNAGVVGSDSNSNTTFAIRKTDIEQAKCDITLAITATTKTS